MKPPPLLVALLALSLVVLAVETPAAAAKEVSKITVCGADGCNSFSDRTFLRRFPFGASTRAKAPPTSPYYTVNIEISHGDQRDYFSLLYVVERDLFAGNSAHRGDGVIWFPVAGTRGQQQLARSSVHGLEPHRSPPSWPRELKSPGRFLVDDEVTDEQPGTSATAAPARQTTLPAQPRAARAKENDALNWWWLALPLTGFAALAAFAVVYRRRSPRPKASQVG